MPQCRPRLWFLCISKQKVRGKGVAWTHDLEGCLRSTLDDLMVRRAPNAEQLTRNAASALCISCSAFGALLMVRFARRPMVQLDD
eukprot:2380261-Alexandrium_andersonii.AAC.1